MVLGAVAAIAIGIIVLIVFFAVAGFLIQLLAPVIAAILIVIVAVAGGTWLYAKYKGR
jgi:lipopolysaccharide export LptBFGC system permease protein LptF